ncbi:TetR/AcrR family transcriptional regulator [Pseudoduganella sp. OTU4001]|uniref:TetR/AcrR family transcriptional regulator n=1 Tax=Pseudoduganella sp. OTU4001 TaxID=3043854 RepID=UPI00313B98A4
MKITKEKAAENRQVLVETASRLFREKGIDGVGVAEISKEAGLTHGALYAHFPSKDALAAEAMEFSNRAAFGKVTERPVSLPELIAYYLAPEQRDNLATGCPLAAAASELARQDASVGAGYTSGFKQMVGYIEKQLPPGPGQREKAQAIMAALIGGVSVSRNVYKSDPKLANEVLESVQNMLLELS